MGSRNAALLEGISGKTRFINIANPATSAALAPSKKNRRSARSAMLSVPRQPAISPAKHPRTLLATASNRNCQKISDSAAPSALRIAIATTLSPTAIQQIARMPRPGPVRSIPPTSQEMSGDWRTLSRYRPVLSQLGPSTRPAASTPDRFAPLASPAVAPPTMLPPKSPATESLASRSP